MAFEYREFPDFSWSQSRRGTFKDCPRRYYWQYYGAHNGWYDDADDTARQAYRLKKISSFYEFLGGVVHELAAASINSARGGERPLSEEELINMGRERLNRAYAQSKRRKDWKRRPNKLTMFHDFYYGNGPGKDLIERIKERLRVCTANLLEAASYREAVEAPYVEVKEVDRGPEYYELEGVTIYAQPDLLYRTGDGEYHVVDWKTGREDQDLHPLQLRTYALYVRSRDDLQDGPIVGHLEYLLQAKGQRIPFSEQDLEEERRGILDSIEMMRKYLVDPSLNNPRSVEEFPLKDDTSDCRFCHFFELCEEEIEGAVSGPF